MANLKEAAVRTVEFLRKYCNLDDMDSGVVFSDPYPIHVDPVKIAQFRRQDMSYAPPTNGDRLQDDYRKMQSFGVTTRTSVEREIFDLVQDSEEFVLIDIGSGHRSYARRVSRERPNARVYLVDRLTGDQIKQELEFDIMHGKNNINFFKKTVPQQEPEAWMNALLEANGYRAKYIHRNMDHTKTPNIPELQRVANGRRVVVTGFRNPIMLPLATINEAISLSVERCYITHSALEQINPDEMFSLLSVFSYMLSHDEMKKIANLIHDPYSRTGNIGRKYDYSRVGHKEIGLSLKQIAILAFAERFVSMPVDISLLDHRPDFEYNQPDHIISGHSAKRVAIDPIDKIIAERLAPGLPIEIAMMRGYLD